MMKEPSTLQCLPTRSWVGLVRFGHAVGWQKTLFLLDTSIPLQGASNGWRMTRSGFWRMIKLTWRLARKQGGLSDHLDVPHVLLFCNFMILLFLFLNLNLIKDSNVPKPLWKQFYHLLIWAIRKLPFYYLCLLSFTPFFCFSFLFPLPCNFYPWRPFGNFRHAHGLFP